MMATYLSRRKTHPILLIRSSHGAPKWVSSMEAQKLAVGESIFTCCERNHKDFGTCDRDVAREVLDRMITKKTEYLFEFGKVISHARFYISQRPWFLRGLSCEIDEDQGEKDFKSRLSWDLKFDGEWFDRDGISILIYSIAARRVGVVKSLLQSLDEKTSSLSDVQRQRRLVSVVPREGFVEVGVTGNMNALSVAMAIGTSNVVCMLLDRGFDPMLSDIAGNHPFLMACITNRIENVKYWLNRFPEWDMESPNAVVGGVALGCTVFMGPNRFELTKLLLECGSEPTSITHTGSSILISACQCEDSDPKVVELLLKYIPNLIVYRRRARTLLCSRIFLFPLTPLQHHNISFFNLLISKRTFKISLSCVKML